MKRDDAKKIITAIKDNFSNGIRDDILDVKKIFCICSAAFPEEKFSARFIRYVIHSEGIKVGKRFYFVSDQDIEKILLFLDVILKRNHIVFYSVVYEKHRDFFSQFNIFSSEILKIILQKHDSENFYFEDFFCVGKMHRLDYEIAKLFSASDVSLSLKDVKNFFPYVPEKRILAELKTKKYLPTISGKYFSVSKVKLDRSEILEAEKKILASADYDFSSNFALNPEISEKALLELIHQIFFADKFILRGKSFFRKVCSPANIIENTMKTSLPRRLNLSFKQVYGAWPQIVGNPLALAAGM